MDKQMPVSAWPDWEIIEKIGEGSFGKVYKAQKTVEGKIQYSAIKVITIPENTSELESIRAEAENEEAVRAYFRALVEECTEEVSTMLRLHGHPNIVTVEDCKVVEFLDDIGWEICIRMEYLTSFTDFCIENPPSEEMAIQLGIDICEALEHCRKSNIIHRDIKPENIFLSEDGKFKLGDFGIAKQIERTMTGMSKKGTFSYMAPEIYRGEKYDNRADIYSLGVVLYKLRNHNRMPFINLEKQLITYRDKENALTRRMSGEMISPPIDASDGLSRVILKACAYQKDGRYASAEDMRKALEDVRMGKEQEPTEDLTSVPTEAIADYQSADNLKPVKEDTFQEYMSEKETIEKEKHLNRILIRIVSFAGVALILTLSLLGYLLWQRVPKKQTYDQEVFQQELIRIMNRADMISRELNGYNWVEDEDNRVRYFDSSWQLMKVLVYPSASKEGVYEEYFYWYGKCFFAYIWTDDVIDYYYFDRDGNLIRWIDQNDICHDYEIKNAEFNERGERYWKNSVEEMEKVQDGVAN